MKLPTLHDIGSSQKEDEENDHESPGNASRFSSFDIGRPEFSDDLISRRMKKPC